MTSSNKKPPNYGKKHKKLWRKAHHQNARKPYFLHKHATNAARNKAPHYHRLTIVPAATSMTFTPALTAIKAMNTTTTPEGAVATATGHKETTSTPAVESKTSTSSVAKDIVGPTSSGQPASVKASSPPTPASFAAAPEKQPSLSAKPDHTVVPDAIQLNNNKPAELDTLKPTQHPLTENPLQKNLILDSAADDKENNKVTSPILPLASTTIIANQAASLLAVSPAQPQQQSSSKINDSTLAPVLTTVFGTVVVGSCIAFLIFLKRRKKSVKNRKGNRVYIYDEDADDDQKNKWKKDNEKQQEEDFFAQPPPLSSQQHLPADMRDTVDSNLSSLYDNFDEDQPSYAKAVLEAYRGFNSCQKPVTSPIWKQEVGKDEPATIEDTEDNRSEGRSKRYTEDTLIGSNRTANSSIIKIEDAHGNKDSDDQAVAVNSEKDSAQPNEFMIINNEEMVEVELVTAGENERLIELLAAAKKVAAAAAAAAAAATFKHESWQTFTTAHTTQSIYMDARTSFAASSFSDIVVSCDEDSTESDGTASVGGNDRDSWIRNLEKALNKNTQDRREMAHQRS